MAEKMNKAKAFGAKVQERIPEILVILLCMVLLGFGVSRKEGFHMDELLSYELANAEFNPWIVPTQPEGRLAKFVHNEIDGDTFGETVQNLWNTVMDVLQNRGNSKLLSYEADVYEEPVWISKEQFQDYITADKGDAFNYLSVYFNVKDDNHPPLHFMVLHTMSSLFQGMAEPWLGCVINMICVAACMVLLMKLGNLLAPAFGMAERSRFVGILAAALFGCSTGAMATTLLIRMYAMVTLFCVALLYFHVKKWLAGEFDKANKGLIAVTVCGFWTQYFFLFYCLILAAVTAVLLGCSKRFRELFVYMRSMVIAAVIGLCTFPFAISDVFSSGRGTEALENLSAGFAGYGSRLWNFGGILLNNIGEAKLLVAVILILLLLNVLLQEKGKLVTVSVEAGNPAAFPQALLWILLLPIAGYFLLAARMSPYQVDRYIMPLFPLVILVLTLLVVVSAQRLEYRSGERRIVYMVAGILLTWQAWGTLCYEGAYQYEGYDEQEQLAAEYEDYPCICVYDGVSYYENLPEFAYYDKTLLIKLEELANRKDTASVSGLEKVVVLLKPETDYEKVFPILQEKYGLAFVEELYSNSVHGDSLYLFVGVQQ